MKKFIVLDTETAPIIKTDKVDPNVMRVYDLGWIVTDDEGTIYEKRSYVIRETMRNIDLMKSAYYADKLPLYYAGLLTGEWIEISFVEAWKQLAADCRKYRIKQVWAYNAYFDRGSLNATIADYSNGFRSIFLPYGVEWFDILAYARNGLCATKRYAKFCEATGAITDHGKPSCSAQNVYRYIAKNVGFTEAHTALQDCEIELAIYRKCKGKGKMPKALGKNKK